MIDFSTFLAESEIITRADLKALERYLDNLFADIEIDIDLLRKHFFQTINDTRNNKQITIGELGKLFRLAHLKYGAKLQQMKKNSEAVFKDMHNDINVPFVLVWNKTQSEMELVAKTIMRKKKFMSRSQILKL